MFISFCGCKVIKNIQPTIIYTKEKVQTISILYFFVILTEFLPHCHFATLSH